MSKLKVLDRRYNRWIIKFLGIFAPEVEATFHICLAGSEIRSVQAWVMKFFGIFALDTSAARAWVQPYIFNTAFLAIIKLSVNVYIFNNRYNNIPQFNVTAPIKS